MVSVIIPTYNREHTILRAVNSVLNQTYTDIELLVVDDGSTDGTKALLDKVQDTRLRYLYLGKNAGPANARNTGVKEAKGEWIAFQDSDDIWRRDKLEKQLAYAKLYPKYKMVYGYCLVHYLEGQKMKCPAEPLPEIMEGILLSTLLFRNVIAAPTMLIDRKAFRQTGGFNLSYNSIEDWEFALRFSKSYPIGFLPEILIDVYMQEGGVSSRIAEYYESRCRMLAENKKELVELGLFDQVALDILTRAADSGIQEQVKQLMMVFLSKA